MDSLCHAYPSVGLYANDLPHFEHEDPRGQTMGPMTLKFVLGLNFYTVHLPVILCLIVQKLWY